MIYWKVQFDDGERIGATGWLILTENLEAIRLTDNDGNDIIESISYHPILFDNRPVWA